MANENFKTPGVYVQELSAFPPSIAQVATAIPAFVGYTQMATSSKGESLTNVPMKINSLLEYQNYFGGPAKVNIDVVYLDQNNAVASANLNSVFYLYDSLQLFYANGGGECYVVSVGNYEDTVSSGGLTAGLDTLENEDEPTLLLFPDAASLEDPADLATVQECALSQCNTLKDRFTIMDLQNSTVAQAAADFRNNISMNNLNYGAAYTPWLQTSLNKSVDYQDIKGKLIDDTENETSLSDLTTDTVTLDTIQSLDNLFDDITAMDDDILNFLNDEISLYSKYQNTLNDYISNKTGENYKDIIQCLFDMASLLDEWAAGANEDLIDGGDMQSHVLGLTIDNTKCTDALLQLISFDFSASIDFISDTYTYVLIYTTDYFKSKNWETLPMGKEDDYDPYGLSHKVDPNYYDYHTIMNTSLAKLNVIAGDFINAINESFDTAKNLNINYETSLYQTFPTYKNIIDSLKNYATQTPPSGAMAGVYAYTDSNVGVWKAPANVGVNSIIGPVEKINDATQEGLNVDPTSGKSINAIRSFTGKGTLVWGARTLAGNDNNWRYISVRRLFIMVEESVQKSISWAVFEPNVATTWVKVKASIENYLTNLWREGALAGNKTNEAFFVNVGLGITMTEDDILNGKMTVVVGMAPVRPAEFILLKFTQMTQSA